MVKITHAAIAAITKEIQDLMNEDKSPLFVYQWALVEEALSYVWLWKSQL